MRELLNWKTDNNKLLKRQHTEKKKYRKYERQLETREDKEGLRLI